MKLAENNVFDNFSENAAKQQPANNSPLDDEPVKAVNQKPLDPATLSKARSLSLDSIKNLGKKIKDRNLSLTSTSLAHANVDNTTEGNQEKTRNIEEKTDKKAKRRESTENSFSGLLTFDQVPTAVKKEGKLTPRKMSTDARTEDKKRKESQSKIHKVCQYCLSFFTLRQFIIC